jgi:hypothetical protein
VNQIKQAVPKNDWKTINTALELIVSLCDKCASCRAVPFRPSL